MTSGGTVGLNLAPHHFSLNTTLNHEFYAVQNGRILLFTSATVRIRDGIRISTSGNSEKFITFTANCSNEIKINL